MKELLRNYWWIPVALAGWGFWLRAHDSVIEERAKSKIAVQRLQERTEQLDVLIKKVDERDSVIQTQRAQITRSNQQAAEAIKATQVSLATSVKEFEATLDSAQKARFAEIEQQHKSIVDLKDQQIAGLNRIIAANDSLNAERKLVQDGLKKLNEDFGKQTRDMLKQMRPSTADKLEKVATGLIVVFSAIGATK